MTFGSNAFNRFFLDTHATREDVVAALLALPYNDGFTNTVEALELVRDDQFQAANGDRADVPNILIILTDGESNVNEERTIPLAEELRAQDVTIYSIGVTNNINETEVMLMSSEPQQLDVNYFISEDFTDLGDVADQIAVVACDVDPSKICISNEFSLPTTKTRLTPYLTTLDIFTIYMLPCFRRVAFLENMAKVFLCTIKSQTKVTNNMLKAVCKAYWNLLKKRRNRF